MKKTPSFHRTRVCPCGRHGDLTFTAFGSSLGIVPPRKTKSRRLWLCNTCAGKPFTKLPIETQRAYSALVGEIRRELETAAK